MVKAGPPGNMATKPPIPRIALRRTVGLLFQRQEAIADRDLFAMSPEPARHRTVEVSSKRQNTVVLYRLAWSGFPLI
ncbi:hypothetical protein X742_17065 [Mesorhizobium sp. LNHC232B00]|nr:hypothetical protein X742_17065 [Mesorhizobium sp. LNHC232B00]